LYWGREVERAYLPQLRGERDIAFYQVKESNVKSGEICLPASWEIQREILCDNIKLWVDIHSGFTTDKSHLIFLYLGKDESVIKRARKINGLLIESWENMKPVERSARDFGIPFILIDAVFHSRTMKNRIFEELSNKTFEEMLRGVFKRVYRRFLSETLEYINRIYDIHAC